MKLAKEFLLIAQEILVTQSCLMESQTIVYLHPLYSLLRVTCF